MSQKSKRSGNGQVQMVKPVVVNVTVEPDQPETPKKRTSHGIECPKCRAVDVRIVNTKQEGRQYPSFIQRHRVQKKRRECECRSCTHKWWQSVKVTEELTG